MNEMKWVDEWETLNRMKLKKWSHHQYHHGSNKFKYVPKNSSSILVTINYFWIWKEQRIEKVMNEDSVDIRFDEDSRRIRVLSLTNYEHYQSMANECDAFVSSKCIFRLVCTIDILHGIFWNLKS